MRDVSAGVVVMAELVGHLHCFSTAKEAWSRFRLVAKASKVVWHPFFNATPHKISNEPFKVIQNDAHRFLLLFDWQNLSAPEERPQTRNIRHLSAPPPIAPKLCPHPAWHCLSTKPPRQSRTQPRGERVLVRCTNMLCDG
jgi:hypothetical protein